MKLPTPILRIPFMRLIPLKARYATICRNYVLSRHLFSLDDYLAQMDDIPLIIFPIKKAINTSDLTDGTYDFFSLTF